MMLSNEDIKEALATGALAVEPIRPDFIRAAGITMHLGARILKPKTGKVVDLKNRITPEYDVITLTDATPYRLEPGEFVLAHTLQKVSVGAKLGFFIEGRSTLARVGLTIVQTAMLVYPGHRDRTVTLELANHGPNPILLYLRMKIARVALFELKTAATELYDDSGKYRLQESVGEPIFNDEIWDGR
jgi:dCTP deaminase